MAGYTDAVFRSLCVEQGADLTFTEMTNAQGLVRDCARTWHMLETVPEETRVVAHIYGSEPDVMAEAARIAEATGRFVGIDINAGCPVSKIMSRFDGAGLLKDLERFEAVIRAVREAVKLPVTVKTRVGITPGCSLVAEAARRAESAGADALTVHARYARMRHKGPALWAELTRAREGRRIPIVGNGGVWKPDDAPRMLAETGVAGLMIGRAAIGNPWLFAALVARLENRPWQPPSTDERRAMMRRHLEALVPLMEREMRFRRKSRLTPEQAACCRFRAHVIKYLLGHRGLRALCRRFQELDSIERMLDAAYAVLDSEHWSRRIPSHGVASELMFISKGAQA